MTVLMIFAFVLFTLAGVLWQSAAEPWRLRMVALGLAFWAASVLGPALFR